MTVFSRVVASVMLGLFAGCAGSSLAVAQPLPPKPLKFIVPFGPGGTGDTLARLIGQHLSERIGQPVIEAQEHRVRVDHVEHAAGGQAARDHRRPALEVRQPAQRPVRGEDHVEAPVEVAGSSYTSLWMKVAGTPMRAASARAAAIASSE